MLEILNRYAHGLASISSLYALRERGCLAHLATGAASAEELAREYSANPGYLDVVLRMLVCLDWLRMAADGRYKATAKLVYLDVIPDRIMELYHFPFDSYLQGSVEANLEPWLERSERRWSSEHPYLPDYLDGLIIIPLLLSLRAQGWLGVTGKSEAGAVPRTVLLPPDRGVRREIERLFVGKGWGTRSADALHLNRAGRFIIDRIFITATVASYRPMFRRAQELLFGDAAPVFARDAAGHETHVDRTINVIGSGFQHEKYFAALSNLVLQCFDGEAYALQPKYIVDMGCGDGSLLLRLYEAVRDRTQRGKVFHAHPLILVAVDFNEKALAQATRTLAGIEHMAIQGDIGDPVALVDTLRAKGIADLERVLHVRSFLDHDRPYRPPEDRDAAGRRSGAGEAAIYIHADGHVIPPGDMIQSTIEHLRRWSQILNPHGLVMLEVHCLAPDATGRHLDESESFHFDAYHAWSHQFLLNAQTFLACAGEAGLFCRQGKVLGFPRNLPFTRISLSHFESRPYVVRRSRDEDLSTLAELEEVWSQRRLGREGNKTVSTSTPSVPGFAETEFVLETQGRLVASVRCDQQETVRLTSAYARPATPHFLRELLQFLEQYWALAGFGTVLGISECQSALPATDDDSSGAGAVARAVSANLARHPFAIEHDPRAAERELGNFSFRWLLANLQRMGVMLKAGEAYDRDALERRIGVAPKYHRYFDALLRRLQGDGLLTLRGRSVETTELVPGYALTSVDEQVLEFKRGFQQRYPDNAALMNLTFCCLSCYQEIITGQIDITEVVFRKANMDIFTEVFRGGVVSDFFNRIVADAVLESVARLKRTGPKLRIVEIGAGTGATTSAILEMLHKFSREVEFCFSDISLSFIRNARHRFGERYPWVEYRLLNIEEDLASQGFQAHSYDIVVAANVLHDTHDVEFALRSVRRLLRPGGLLLLDEFTSVKDCLFFSGALMHGYWLFQDPERRLKDSCLLGVSQWMEALRRAGFSVVGSHALPTQTLGSECSQSIFLCEALQACEMEDASARIQAGEGERLESHPQKAEILCAVIRQQALMLLGEERAAAYSARRPLMDMGLDSIELVELKSLVERCLGVKLTPMFLFEHETTEKMAAALSAMVSNEQLQGLLPTGAAGEPENISESAEGQIAEAAPHAEHDGGAIAIVGVACRFPGGAVSAESFWGLLESGNHGIVSMPPGRWEWPPFIDPSGEHEGIDKAGFLERIDEFDAPFFRISPKEAKLTDPQQRLLLQLSWQAMEDAGHRPSGLSGRKIGVFVGVCHGDYREVLTNASDSAEAYVGTGSAYSLLANRLSYFYDFKGPSQIVDTACSSSLVALHHAVVAIRRGDCEQALVGAANLLCSPTNSISYYRAGMLSPTGACRTFDETADGYVRGEGGAMLLLKPLAMALAEGDSIYGVVKGTAVNHGGQAASLTAPKPEAQAAVIEAAWQAADVAPPSVGYVEAHGTGTRLGDPVEIGGLIEAFRRLYRARNEHWPPKPHCGLGSVKTNIGHLEGAAGLAGLIKVLMAMRHRTIPASLHFERINHDIDLAGSPFYIVERNRFWPKSRDERGRELPRRAGVSSFGFGGANAHAAIEEYATAREESEAADGPCLIPLSARNIERLIDRARGLLEFLQSGWNASDSIAGLRMSAVAYTLQVGREAMEERVAFVVQSREGLIAGLRAYVAGEYAIDNCHPRNVDSQPVQVPGSLGSEWREQIDICIASRDLDKLASLWVSGLALDWNQLYGETKPQRMSLPAYPFAKERYWVDTEPGGTELSKGAAGTPSLVAPAILHPLLHCNTSDLTEQRYCSTFTGEEFFLADHEVAANGHAGQKVLPGVAYLEMARAAIEQAWPGSPEGTLLELHDLVWGPPIVVDQKRQVSIALLAQGAGDDGIAYEIYSGDGLVVHCQGRAKWSRRSASATLDLAELKGQVMQVRLPSVVVHTWADFVLHPSLLGSALQACSSLLDGISCHPQFPIALKSMRIVSSCSTEMLAWARYSPGSQSMDSVVKLDIDLCDERGNICIQLQGLSWQGAAHGTEPSTEEVGYATVASANVAVARKEIAWSLSGQTKLAQVEPAKPKNLVLATHFVPLERTAVRSKPTRVLCDASLTESALPSSVRLFDEGAGIFSIEVAASSRGRSTQERVIELHQALSRVQQESSLKVVMLSGIERCLPGGGREAYNAAVSQGLYQAIVSFPYPLIAVLEKEVSGAGFLAASLCDLMVCNEESFYGYSDGQTAFYPTAAEAALLSERFGGVGAQGMLFLSGQWTGKQLRAQGWTCPMVAGAEVEERARQLASTLASKSQMALRLLKQHLTRRVSALVETLRQVEAERPCPAASGEIVCSAKHIRLDRCEAGVVVVRLCKVPWSELVEELGLVFGAIQQSGCCRAMVLAIEDEDFLLGAEPWVAEQVVSECKRLMEEAEIAVVVSLAGGARGHAWLMGQLGDGCVYSRAGTYSSAGLGTSALSAAMFMHRLGSTAGREVLLTGADYSGFELQQRVGGMLTADPEQVLPLALQLASFWSQLSPGTLAGWRQQRRSLSTAGWPEQDLEQLPAVGPIALVSKVVTATVHPEGIVVVRLEDRQAKNMFSELFLEGVTEVFGHIERTAGYKVVVLTGYDSYFVSGGTKENLLAIQGGQAKFTDRKIFQVALECKLPVIAAMQGHGIGAGWALGMFADVVVLSEESQYVSPYMNYGFTPGAGATYILADKMGQDLARESLLTGEPLTGSQLRARGLRLRVLPRAEVYEAAMRLARQMAQASRGRLLRLKQQLSQYHYEPLDETYQLELAMHEKTFVGQSDTLAQIHSRFFQEVEAPPASPQPHKRAADRAELMSLVSASLRTLLANELQMRESEIDEDVQFVDLGLDSISAVTWIRKINEKYGTAIVATKVYSYSTLSQLARYVKEEAEKHGTLSSHSEPPASGIPEGVSSLQSKVASRYAEKLTSWRSRPATRFSATSAAANHLSSPIAVIGMAGQFAQARNLEEFWQNIAQGRDCITEVPSKRWDCHAYYQAGDAVSGKTNSRWVGALEDYDLFDPLFFNISPAEAESMDPQQRLFLQACWQSIEDGGYDARLLSGSKCGVFVGCAAGDYHQQSRQHQLSAQDFTGSSMSILAARISYFLNLQGPCISIDTACSSSLVAIAHACDSLTAGGSDLALAGGVYVMAGPEMHILTSQAGMLSPHGKCFTFDQRADGFVPGEGVGVVLLKRLAEAQRDQDIIYGVIQGWGINQDGKTNGITAPNPESQTRLEQEIYDKYQIDPADIQLIEAHGTGTKLGDPIEVEGLKSAFQKYTPNKQYCALGSIKSNIGHCLWAAGIAGVLKLMLALKHQQLPPTIHFEQLNEHLDLNDSPFYVNTRLQAWERGSAPRRQAAISSFGFSGTNAHVVIGEYLPPAGVCPPVSVIAHNTATIVPLSARTAEQLKQKASDLLRFLRRESPSIHLAEVAYTLQRGRQAMEERVGFLVSSIEELQDKLEAHLAGARGIEDAHQGQRRSSKEGISIINQDDEVREVLINKWIASGKFSKLLELWVKGLELDWNKLYGGEKPQRISLPTYPFAKERYWFDSPAASTAVMSGSAPSAAPITTLHPLLHSNTSDLNEQRYSSTFTGEEYFLAEHGVCTDGHTVQRVLPGVAYLEMVRAAIERAWPAEPESKASSRLPLLELHNIVWAQPMVVIAPKQASIVLMAADNNQNCDQVDYEVHSHDEGQEGDEKIVHCQGRAVWSRQSAPPGLDLEGLKKQMRQGRVGPQVVYQAFARIGIVHGSSFQAITAIHLGSNESLVELRLPDSLSKTSADYVLHPSLMDGALQGHVGLIVGWSGDSNQTRLPFALETLRIVSPCTREMVAWVRYAPETRAADQVLKLDIDLCDQQGNICVQMRGFSSRLVGREMSTVGGQNRLTGVLLATPAWRAGVGLSASADEVAYTERQVVLCGLPVGSAERLEFLLPHSQCMSLHCMQEEAGEAETIGERYSDCALQCFERIQGILQGKPQGRVLFQVVVVEDEQPGLLAGLSGLLKTATLENPRLVGQLVLVPGGMGVEELGRCLEAEKSCRPDPVIRFEHGERQVLCWREVAADEEEPPIAFQDQGVYLITGGLGGLGILFAREIVKQVRTGKVILTGRSTLSAEKQTLLEELSAPPGCLSYRQVDVCDAVEVRRLIADIHQEHGKLTGILHCAGQIADNFILKKSSAEFSQVLAPKVSGTCNLDEATQDVELDFLVLFSSLAGALGNVGQADYAAGNGFMDQFAGYRNGQVAAGRRHGRTRSINWGLWQGGGMGLDAASRELLEQTTGIKPMAAAAGIAAFYRSLALPYAQLLAVQGDLDKMGQALLDGRPIQTESSPFPITGKRALTPEIDAAKPQSDLQDKTQDYLRGQCSGLLKLAPHKIDPEAALETYGIDSILAMKLTNQLEKTFGSLPKTLFFEYQTIRELTKYFIRSHSARLATLFVSSDDGDRQPTRVNKALEAQPVTSAKHIVNRRFRRMRDWETGAAEDADLIAIIGLSGRYPEAIDVQAYWRNLRQGRDCIVEVPKERWDWRDYFTDDRSQQGRHYCKWGGFIPGVDEFDPLFFNISPREARDMDPQERLFLQHAWMAVEDAGYTRSSLEEPDRQDLAGQAGVYVGVWSSEYQLLGAEASLRGKRMGIAVSIASIANRVSYALNLHGPSMTLDTMCSSSLTAIHVACQDLKQGRTSLAIAGGVNVSIHPNKYLLLSSVQAISGDGHCRSFGDGGDGYVPGEGVGVVVLKRLTEAERDGDHVYGIIRGSALTHGGKTNGYSVPNPQAQTSAIRRALAESHTSARHISYIEAHGTGTRLGDPIEIAALRQAFDPDTQDTGFCQVGSVKSNIGHGESAAGIAGLTKILLQMQHQEIVPSLHSARLNPNVDFSGSPFVVSQELSPWEQPVVDGRKLPRIAGISSFGAGGSNAHLVVEEYQRAAERPVTAATVVLLLSTRTAEQLKQKAGDLLEFVRARLSSIDLVAMAYTLQVGREGMEERLALVVSSVQQAAEKLEAYLADEQGIEDFYRGQGKRNQEVLLLFSSDGDLQQAIDKWMQNKKLGKLALLWVKGVELDWNQLYGETKPQRMSLPGYPFAKERYWVDTEPAGTALSKGAAGTPSLAAPVILHPLLHCNTSDLSEQRYCSTFTGEEFFLSDHQVAANGHAGQKVLSGVAYLEMARAAIEQAWPGSPESTLLELHDLVWGPPMVVDQKRQVSIALLAQGSGDDEIAYEIYSGATSDKPSEKSDGLVVHCQGRAKWSRRSASATLDLAELKRQVMQVRLPSVVAHTWADFVLHPSLLGSALQACSSLLDGISCHPQFPIALESIRIISSCSTEMLAWARYGAGCQRGDSVTRLDIDLCDESGNVAVQMRGLTWKSGLVDNVERVVDQQIAISMAGRKEIVFVAYNPPAPAPVEPKKPTRIPLTAANTVFSEVSSESARPRLLEGRAPRVLCAASLALAVEGTESPLTSSVRLFDEGNGIFSIEVAASSRGQSTQERVNEFHQALSRAQQESSLKVVMLSGIERCFPGGGREAYNAAVSQGLYQAIVSFPYPLIAVLEKEVSGAGFLAASLCDLMVCNEESVYGYSDGQAAFYPTAAEAALLSERFGGVDAQGLLFLSGQWTGKQLRAQGWTCPMVAGAQVEGHARQLASTLSSKSQMALRLLKQHLTRRVSALVETLRQVEAERPCPAASGEIVCSAKHIRLDRCEAGVVVVRLCKVPWSELVEELGLVFGAIHEAGCCRAMVLAIEDQDFLLGAEPAVAEQVVSECKRLMEEAEIAVVVSLAVGARGHGWLIGQLGDGCVYSRAGTYSSAGLGTSALSAAMFMHRLGSAAGREILLSGADYSGFELQQRVGGMLTAEPDQVLPLALQLASFWSHLPAGTLVGWRHQMRSLSTAGWPEQEAALEQLAAVGPIALASKVVTATVHPEGIVVVRLEDRQAKNMFSELFLEGVTEVFGHIERTAGYKVVVLTGYDSYFVSGGTKENLLAIQGGQAKFTDRKIFQVALECKLPVIAAMQGHGIGAGWALGMFADVVVLSEESQYVSPYMNYGFTPGAGATYILADKMGEDLARESLLTGEPLTGSQLRARGLRLRVLPRAEVYEAAMRLARQMAQASRGRLLRLKQQLSQYHYQPLDETYQLELAMHEKTFVGQSNTLAQIHSRFFQEVEAPPASPQPHKRAADRAEVLLPVVSASLRTLLANELQMRESEIDEDVQFVDLGLDSISAVTWIRKINEKYGTAIVATKVYSYSTLSQLARYVKEEAEKHGTLSSHSEPPASGIPEGVSSLQSKVASRYAEKLTSWRSRPATRFSATSAAANHLSSPIAVIGMAGQFAQARNLEEFWQNIAQGRDCITEVPSKRWDCHAYYQAGDAVSGKTNSRWVGALEDYDLFDPLFFNISPAEAESMDPQQRLFLQACWQSIEDGGYDARLLSGSKCGVFVGCAAGDYHQQSRQHQLSAQDFTGSSMSILAARISYFLNLQGPCISIDTACSSSLVAIAHACDSLTAGGSDLALAGGVYVMAGPEMHILTSQAGMLSPHGKCFTFDRRADGFVPGEGVGVVLLKRLAEAQRDQDIIYGVIQGWGINQDGKTNGITAPNPESQTRLEQEIYDKYQIDPADIQLIEAHGTGTKLGDPIEVEGLKSAFQKYTRKKQYCALGSIKSNIGHCLTAAGIAGVLKLMLALKHKQLPPTIHFEQLNEHLDLNDSPFYVNTRLQAWERGSAQRRQAAISSFGFSGTNAHMVIGEYLPPAGVCPPVSVIAHNTATIVPLSARTAEQLKQKASDLLEFVRAGRNSIDLVAMAYTLQVGREAMEERLGLVASSIEQVAEKLDAYVSGKQSIEDVFQGQSKRNQETLSLFSTDGDLKQAIDKWMANRKLSQLLELWVKGLELDWTKLYGETKPQRISLPTYPFAKERYWFATGQTVVGASGILHPLLHRNTSDLSEQRYTSTFTGDEFFLADHQVRTDGRSLQRVLPGVAYLEMARAAVELASPSHPDSAILELYDTVWLKPIVVRAPRQVFTALHANGNGGLSYEIYSLENEQRNIHCQGQASFSPRSTPVELDLGQLKDQMDRDASEPSGVYAIFAKMGLNYGPAHQGIRAIYRGEKQLLAELRLPQVVEASRTDYVLHPSLLDGALQASIGLIIDLNNIPSDPPLPFVVEFVRILSPCTREMVAWVRYAPEKQPTDRVVKLDIDLCDQQGNVCLQMQGISSRVADGEIDSTHQEAGRNRRHAQSIPIENDSSFDCAFYQKLVADVVNREVSVEEAIALG